LIILLIAIACLAALATSTYPGVLSNLVEWTIVFSFVFGIAAVPIAGVVALTWLILFAGKGPRRETRIAWKPVGVLLGLLVFTCILLAYNAPCCIAFAACRSSFEELVPHVPASAFRGTPLNRRLGIYWVDQYAADARGGVYFRTYWCGDGLGPDRMSYGFAYKPNQKGSPFGAARYQVLNLGNHWYWFCASDDWY
jgi:hypothetical protein